MQYGKLRRMWKTHRNRWGLAAALALVLVACSQSTAPKSDFQAYFASEFLPYAEAQNALPLLQKHGHGLIVAIPRAKIGDAALAKLLQATNEQEVPVVAWFLLDDDNGYWLNEANIPAVRETLIELMDWLDVIDAGVVWLGFDMEPTLQVSSALDDHLSSGEIGAAVDLLAAGHNPVSYQTAVAGFAEIAELAHQRGYRTQAYVFPPILHDHLDGDADLQDVLGTPLAGVGFKQWAVMAYRTVFEAYVPLDATSYFVYDAAVNHAPMPSTEVIVGVGTIGDIGKIELPGFTRPEQLHDDIAALMTAGHNKAFVFSLDGLVIQDDPEAWLDFSRIEAHNPEPDTFTAAFYNLFAILDGENWSE